MEALNEKSIRLEWFGHSVIKIQIHDKILFFDPIRKNKLLETSLEPITCNNVSAIFISHDHWDHFDADTIISLSSPKTRVYCPFSVASLLSHRLSFEADDMKSLQKLTELIFPIQVNTTIEIDGVKIVCLEATEGISFLIKHNQKKILFMGDSIATQRMIKEKPDIIIFPVWAVEGEEADLDSFIKLADEGMCIPIHYHNNPDALPNFFIKSDKLRELLPENINLNILERNYPIGL